MSKPGDTQAQTSYIGAQASYLTTGTTPANVFINSSIAPTGRRPKTNSPTSRYRFIPTENVKFEKFMDLIYKSKMRQDDIKDEILNYVQAIETNYNDTIRYLKDDLIKEKTRLKKLSFEKVQDVTEKNQLEGLFVECIEEVRKDIMKRRLKNEIFNKKKF
jgi:hypothetical protein